MIRLPMLTITGLLDYAEEQVRRMAWGQPEIPQMAFSADRGGWVTAYSFPRQDDGVGRRAVEAILVADASSRNAVMLVLCGSWAKHSSWPSDDEAGEMVRLEARSVPGSLATGRGQARFFAVQRGADGLVCGLLPVAYVPPRAKVQ